MVNSTASDLSLAEAQPLPCPSCGGETSEEFVANGPSKGLRTTCRSCGPIDVLSIAVIDLPADEPPAEEISFTRSTEGTPAASPNPAAAGFSFAPSRSVEPRGSTTTDALSFAAAEADPEPVDEETEATGLEPPEESSLVDDARRLLEEAAAGAPQRAGAAPEDAISQVGHRDASFEMTPGAVTGRIRHSATNVAGQARNRQVALVGLGGVAALAGLIGLDLYLRPLSPTSVPEIPRPARAALAPVPAEVEPPAVAAESHRAQGSPARVAAKPARPAVEAPKAVALAKAAVPRQEAEVSSSRWFSQTGVPPTRRNAIVQPGVYSAEAAAQRAAVVPAAARAETRPTVEAAALTEGPAPGAGTNPLWQSLRPGMTGPDVVRTLGKPRWKATSVALEFWMYEQQSIMGSGVVIFDNRGVFSWREPSRPLPQG